MSGTEVNDCKFLVPLGEVDFSPDLSLWKGDSGRIQLHYKGRFLIDRTNYVGGCRAGAALDRIEKEGLDVCPYLLSTGNRYEKALARVFLGG